MTKHVHLIHPENLKSIDYIEMGFKASKATGKSQLKLKCKFGSIPLCCKLSMYFRLSATISNMFCDVCVEYTL